MLDEDGTRDMLGVTDEVAVVDGDGVGLGDAPMFESSHTAGFSSLPSFINPPIWMRLVDKVCKTFP